MVSYPTPARGSSGRCAGRGEGSGSSSDSDSESDSDESDSLFECSCFTDFDGWLLPADEVFGTLGLSNFAKMVSVIVVVVSQDVQTFELGIGFGELFP